jgi:PST family polysaccharide transporter
VERAWRSPTLRNLFYLYAVQAANYLFPLLTLPYLARVLGPEGFGKLALAQALLQYLYLVLEYGFQFTATREVARSRGNRTELGAIVAGVLHARVLLLLPLVPLGVGLGWAIPLLRGNTPLVLGALLGAIGQGFNPLWFFQGLERMGRVALLELVVRGGTTLGVFFLVRTPQDVAVPIYLQAVSYWLSALWGLSWIRKEVDWPGLVGGFVWLRKGFAFSLYNLATLLYTSLNVTLASLFVPPAQVGQYAGAERLVRPLVNLWSPITRLFFPRLSFAFAQRRPEARRWLLQAFLLTLGTGGLVGGLLFLLAPLLVPWFLGPGFEGAVPMVRTFAFFLVLSALSSFVGLQLLLPMQLDRLFLGVSLLAGVLNVVLALWVLPRWGVRALPWVVVGVEAWVSLGMLSVFFLARRRG